jgi:hypothetical protein
VEAQIVRAWKTLSLAALLVSLLGYVYLFERAPAERSARLLEFRPEDVESLSIAYAGAEVRLQRQPAGRWQLVAPVRAAAEPLAVSRVLSSLADARVTRTIAERPTPQELKEFGLDPPWARVSVTLTNGVTLPTVLVGAKSPVGHSAYARREPGSAVLLTSAALVTELDRKPADFRSKRLLDLDRTSLKEIRVERPRGAFALVKKGADWHLVEPRAERAAQPAAGALLSALEQLTARELIDVREPELRRYGLEPPRLRVSVATEKERQEIVFGALPAKGEIYAARAGVPTVYVLAPGALAELQRDWTQLRDRDLFPHPLADWTRLEIVTAAETLTLARSPAGQWEALGDGKRKADPASLAELVEALRALRAEEVVSAPPAVHGLESPVVRLALAGKAGALTTLSIGKRAGDARHARREENGVVYRLAESSYARIAERIARLVPSFRPTA